MQQEQTEQLKKIRHSCEHVLTQAMYRLYPGIKMAMGPATEDGFYFDFDPGENKIALENFPKIEKEMNKIIAQSLPVVKKEVSINEARELFKDNKYKQEWLNEIEQSGETPTLYWTGEPEKLPIDFAAVIKKNKFVDLCAGPHVESLKEIKAFKLTKLAGAYWRGDEKNKMLVRIYGVAFEEKNKLEEYLEMLKEAEKRDHRKLGKELDLFCFSDLVGKGLPLWTKYGATVRRELENFIIKEEIKRGYQHVITPELAKLDLYRKSGHYPYYKDSMYPPMKSDGEELMLRPMTCPHHFMLYSDKKRSYRELPMRIAELARLFRYEQSGELTGMIRVRSFCLADAHIVCTKEQAKNEIKQAIELIEYVASVFGLVKGTDYSYRLSLGDRNDTKKYYKNDQEWDYAEQILRQVLKELDAPFVEAEHEAAFYGPKIDIQMKNVMGKEDTAFTVQYDFCMPDRFELAYTDKDGQEKRPIIVHRSSIGAIERIFGFLIERFAGAFPLWLSPVQLVLISVGEAHKEYCNKLAEEFREKDLRVEVWDESETVGNKIRKATGQKIPYMLVIGDKEMSSANLYVRKRGSQEVEEVDKDKFIENILRETKEKR